jgi:2-polyprenyl-6-methoxyphenol hydroxylase-like FAD-dependent oxidoreductase
MIAPQARFLELLHERARRYPHFTLTFNAYVQELVEESGAIVGVRYKDAHGAVHEVRAPLTVAADGRGSRLAKLAGLEPVGQSPEMDVIWLRLPKREGDTSDEGAMYSADGQFMVMFERDREWQAGYVIAKGAYKRLHEAGIEKLQQNVARLVPWLADRVGTIDDWTKAHMLTVRADRLPLWHKPGLLFIGDAAHAMSPVGGVGINYAIGDAVETANVLSEKLREGRPIEEADLAEIQRRREPVVRLIQRIQGVIQKRVVGETLRHKKQFVPPWPLRLMSKTPVLRNIPGRMVAFGPRPFRLERAEEFRSPGQGSP